MTIRLGDLRQYTQDVAYDVSDAKANRLMHRWINAALVRVSSLRDWAFYDTYEEFVVEAASSGSGLALTNGSTLATLTGETFQQKHADDGYDLVVGSEVYKLSAVNPGDPTQATLAVAYQGTTGTGLSYKLSKPLYSLANTPSRITMVRSVSQHRELVPASGALVDAFRNLYQGHVDSHAYRYAWRGKKILLWPGPSTESTRIGVSYHRIPERVSSTDDDEAEVDWDLRFQDLLERAVEIEVAKHQGNNAQISYELALIEFDQAYARACEVEVNTVRTTGSMDVYVPGAAIRPRITRATSDIEDTP